MEATPLLKIPWVLCNGDCDTPQLFDTLSKDFPEKPEEVQPIGRHVVGTEVHWVLHEPLRYAEEGCTKIRCVPQL